MNKKRKIFFIAARILIMVGVSVFLLSSWRFKKNSETRSRQNCEVRMLADAEFASAGIREVLLSAESYITLLSKMPFLRKFDQTETLGLEIDLLKEEANDWTDAYQFEIGFAYQRFLLLQRTMVYWSELPKAAIRRIAYEFLPSWEDEENLSETDDANGLFSTPELSKAELERIHRETVFARNLVHSLKALINSLLEPLHRFVRFFGSIANFGHTMLVEKNETEKFLSVATNNRGIIAGIDVTNVYGKSQLDFSKTGISNEIDASEICRALESGRSFWNGPVTFNEKDGRSYWQVAVPIRSRFREFKGCVRAAIDLNFLSDWFGVFSSASGTEMLVLDKDFVTIASSSSDRKRNQVSFAKAIFYAKSGPDISGSSPKMTKLAEGETILLQPISKFRASNLPEWKVLVVRHALSEDEFYEMLAMFALIILAAVGGYVLFYCAVQLINLYEEEAVNDR